MLVSEKSALGTNSVPSKGTIKILATKIVMASSTVAILCTSDQRRIFW